MKKNIISFLAVILVFGSFTMTAAAATVDSSVAYFDRANYDLCNIKNCETPGVHYHNNITYSGHYYEDGHEHSEILCPYANCGNYGSHMYNGNSCYSRGAYNNNSTSYGYRNHNMPSTANNNAYSSGSSNRSRGCCH